MILLHCFAPPDIDTLQQLQDLQQFSPGAGSIGSTLSWMQQMNDDEGAEDDDDDEDGDNVASDNNKGDDYYWGRRPRQRR